MAINRKLAFDGVSSQVFEHKQVARELAVRHFNQSTVIDLHLSALGNAYVNEAGGVNVQAFEFKAIDDTGREAYIAINSAESPHSGFVSITTWHNDLFPHAIFD